MKPTNNIRVNKLKALIPPQLLTDEQPITQPIQSLVEKTRNDIANVLNGQDDRLVVVIGPCSIHDPKSAIEYAQRLQKAAEAYKNELCIIMRVYFEKPRTTVGWKGLINDPGLDGEFAVNDGLRLARQLLIEINSLGLPTGTEFLDTTIPQYIADLTSWAAIGARTTESQIHRELASGLSMPVGFKNGTSGDIKIAVDAIMAAKSPHHFLGVTEQGVAAIISTSGNSDCHVILRGSNDGPNYDAETVDYACRLLNEQKLTPRLMVDCSHGNSRKEYKQQLNVLTNLCERISVGDESLFGVMIESHLVEGKQNLNDKSPLVYGQSITDACIGWEDSVIALKMLSSAIQHRRVVQREIFNE